MPKTFPYDDEDVFDCDHCGDQIYIKVQGRRRIPVTWLTGEAHNCDRPWKAGERHGPKQERKIIWRMPNG